MVHFHLWNPMGQTVLYLPVSQHFPLLLVPPSDQLDPLIPVNHVHQGSLCFRRHPTDPLIREHLVCQHHHPCLWLLQFLLDPVDPVHPVDHGRLVLLSRRGLRLVLLDQLDQLNLLLPCRPSFLFLQPFPAPRLNQAARNLP